MYARKNYLKQLEDSEGNGLVKVITGIRRAGKSVLLSDLFHKHLLDHGVDERQIIDIALDDREYAEFLNPDVFLSYVKSRIRNGERNYILIDEVQMMLCNGKQFTFPFHRYCHGIPRQIAGNPCLAAFLFRIHGKPSGQRA